MRLIIDARALDLYRGWSKGGFFGGSETYVMELARGLASKGHTVHLVTPDEGDEQHGERLFYWGPEAFPTKGDAVIMVPSLENIEPYTADILICATNGIGHNVGGSESGMVDAFPVFSECHADLLAKHQGVDRAKCFVTGLGVGLADYDDCLDLEEIKVPGRILVGNDPQRGLWHVLDIFDKLRESVPHATLHVTYDCQKVFDQMRWQASHMATMLLDCERRLKATDGVVYLGPISRQELIREQLECQVHVWPSDPPNIGSQIHGMYQMECAAAGAALVLSDIEAFPEIFGETAVILPTPGAFMPADERRCDAQDWAEAIAEIMKDTDLLADMSRRSRALAERNAWGAVVDRWQEMLVALTAKVPVAA